VQRFLDWAVTHPQIEKVFLSVFHTNQNAIKLYLSLGFKEEGRHIKAAKQPSGEYVDVVQMYLETKCDAAENRT
jgi:RimJ/RimL family protein N-acetyltransferase